MEESQLAQLKQVSVRVRRDILDIVTRTKSSHIGSAYSVADILIVLYNLVGNISPGNILSADRDVVLLSKGHAAIAQYVVLAANRFFPRQSLTFAEDDSPFTEHPTHGLVPGIELSTGSLGHGPSVGCGFALAKKLSDHDGRVFVILGDGECDEGTVWEAAQLAQAETLDNLVFLVDSNGLQGLGPTAHDAEALNRRFGAFGWETKTVNGHAFDELGEALTAKTDHRPLAIIAETIKGKGVSFMENKLEWHYRSPSVEEYTKAKEELAQ